MRCSLYSRSRKRVKRPSPNRIGASIGAIRTTVTVEDGQAILNGVKCWVANGDTAGILLVFAKNEDGEIDAFLVSRDASGLSVGQRELTLGMRSVSFHTIYFERCSIPLVNRLGERGKGGEIAAAANQRSAVALAGVALGIASSACDVAADFASDRVQFGVPIAKKQAIQNFIAQAHVDTESLRNMLYRAAWMADSQQDLRSHAEHDGRSYRDPSGEYRASHSGEARYPGHAIDPTAMQR